MLRFTWQSTAVIGLTLSTAYNWSDRETVSRWQFFGSFAGFWASGLVSWVVWKVWVYPLMVAPERHLPSPKGNHWLMGQALEIMKEIPGGAELRW